MCVERIYPNHVQINPYVQPNNSKTDYTRGTGIAEYSEESLIDWREVLIALKIPGRGFKCNRLLYVSRRALADASARKPWQMTSTFPLFSQSARSRRL